MVNIILTLTSKPEWLTSFLDSKGHIVLEELLLTLLGSEDPSRDKIVVKLCHILIKVMENDQPLENVDKLCAKMLEAIRQDLSAQSPN